MVEALVNGIRLMRSLVMSPDLYFSIRLFICSPKYIFDFTAIFPLSKLRVEELARPFRRSLTFNIDSSPLARVEPDCSRFIQKCTSPSSFTRSLNLLSFSSELSDFMERSDLAY